MIASNTVKPAMATGTMTTTILRTASLTTHDHEPRMNNESTLTLALEQIKTSWADLQNYKSPAAVIITTRGRC